MSAHGLGTLLALLGEIPLTIGLAAVAVAHMAWLAFRPKFSWRFGYENLQMGIFADRLRLALVAFGSALVLVAVACSLFGGDATMAAGDFGVLLYCTFVWIGVLRSIHSLSLSLDRPAPVGVAYAMRAR